MRTNRIRSAVLTGNKKIEVRESYTRDPEADECAIRVDSVGICASDLPRAYRGGAYFYPLIMGHEISGEIIKLGSDIGNEFQVGDRVSVFPLIPCFQCVSCIEKNYALCQKYSYYGSRKDGGFTEVLNVKNWNLIKLPSNVSLEDGALVEPTSVVLHALKKLNINATSKTSLCIIGAGFLGLIAAEIACRNYPECHITIIDRNQFKLNLLANLPIKTICVDDRESWDSFLSKHKDSFANVAEFVGSPETYSAAIDLAAPKSKLVWAGNISTDLTLKKEQVSSILRKELTIFGTWNSVYQGPSDCDWTEAISMMQKGFMPSKFISLRVGLEMLDSILSQLNDHKDRKSKFDVIKVVVDPSRNKVSG